MRRPPLWKPLAVMVVSAVTATAVYLVARPGPSPRNDPTVATHTTMSVSPSQTAPVVVLRQSFVADPPFGSGFITHGTYLQVSGVDHLEAVNAALRQLIIDDQARDRINFAPLTPAATTPPGEYGSGPGKQPTISATSMIVSVLLGTEVVPPDGEWHDSWVSATLLVPSAHPVLLASLFTDSSLGLAAVAAAAKQYLLTNVPCAAEALADPGGGDVAAAGLDPGTPENHRHFAMVRAGLVIGFEQEQVGPHACGNFTATVAWSTIRSLLSPVGTWLVDRLR